MLRLPIRATFVLAACSLSVPASATPFQTSPDALIREGRELLERGQPNEAQVLFETAAELDGSPAVRFWLVRGWIAQGRLEEALGAADELREAGAPAADADYLLGLALLGQAKKSIATGGGAYTQDQLSDSYALLSRATAADPLRFADAWLPCAEAGWYAAELEGARLAVERAIELRAEDPEAHALRGRIAFSQFSAVGTAGDSPVQEEYWSAALDSFRRTIELRGEPADVVARGALADAHLQIGHLHAWKQDPEAAASAYARAMEWDPGRVDFAQVRSTLGSGFADCVAQGARLYAERFGRDDPAYATLSWWNGYAGFEGGRWPEAEAAFRTAVELWPAYTNSWFYIFRLCYSQAEYGEAVEALRSYLEVDPDGLVAMLSTDATNQVNVIDWLVGWCADPQKHDGRALNEAAAGLSEVLTRVQPDESRHWNNLGLFVRDQGDQLRWSARRDGTAAPDPDELQRLWQRAFEAYARALELEPDNPNYVNDYGVMLHYYFQRDFDRAGELYRQAQALAERALAREDLPPADRAAIEIALRDSRDNQRRLATYLERVAAGEDVAPDRVR